MSEILTLPSKHFRFLDYADYIYIYILYDCIGPAIVLSRPAEISELAAT